MPDKELPPLRVRLTGDHSDLDKSIDKALDRLQKSFASLKFDIALKDAKTLASTINGIRMNALLTQAQQTKTVLRELAKIKMTPLDSEVEKVLKKFRQIDTIHRNLQKGTFRGGSGGPGASMALAAASIAKSISDAIIKSAPHIGRVISQAFRSADKALYKFMDSFVKSINAAARVSIAAVNAAGRIFASATNLFGNALRTVATTINVLGGAVKSAASVIASAANVFKSVSTVVVASLRSAAQVLSAAIRGSAQVASTAIRSAGQVAATAIQTAGRIAAAAISSGVNASSRVAVSVINGISRSIVGVSRSAATVVSTGIRTAGQAAAQAIRGASQMGTQLIKTAGQLATARMRASASSRSSSSASPSRPSGGLGGGFGDGLTSRADIYMHANALRTLAQSGKGLLELRINLQQAEIGIRAFTGNAQQAAQVMADLRDHAEKTSFTTLGLSEAVRNMMSYGLSAKDAVAAAKMLGDVAAGNSLRFERLSFAMSQITSMGILQGNELRQLTEQGFNPLETMAKRTGMSMLELRKKMEKGEITAQHVTEALKIETSAGGRFANMQKEMAKSLGGVIAQATELTQNLRSDLLGLLERDMIAAMTTFIGYLKQLQAYLATPQGKKFARDMMNIAKYTLLAVASFHIVGFAIASVMWWIQSAVSTVSRLTFIFRLLGIIGSAAISILTSPFALVMVAIGAAVAAVLYFSGAVAGPNSAYSAMLALWDITQWFFNNAVGFFQNFQWNWTILTLWFQSQWKNILTDMIDGGAAMVSAMIENYLTMFRMMSRLWVVFATWLFTLYEGLFSGEIYEAMVGGFIKVFTWLEKKWKDLGSFVSLIWENLFDPEALYEIMTKGMGIEQLQQNMTEDIMRTREKGLYAGIEGVVKDESGNFKTGLEGYKPKTDAAPLLSILKFSQTNTSPLPPKPGELADAAAYTGPGFTGLTAGMGEAKAAVSATSFGSSAYNEKLAQQAARFDFSGKPKQNPLVAGQQQTNTLLGKILSAVSGSPSINLQPAGVAGGGTTP